MADTRKDKRAPVSLKVRFKSATVDEFIEQYSTDISRGGIFIKSKNPMPVGTLLKFEFQLKDESRLIHGVGRVVWKREAAESPGDQAPPGMGIKFIKMDPESRTLVERIVQSRGDGPAAFESGGDGVPARAAVAVAAPVPVAPPAPPGPSPFAASRSSRPAFANVKPLTGSGSTSSTEDSKPFFPSTTPKDELPAAEDSTQIRHASELLGAALGAAMSDSEGAAEAERKAAEARKRTEEIERERAAARALKEQREREQAAREELERAEREARAELERVDRETKEREAREHASLDDSQREAREREQAEAARRAEEEAEEAEFRSARERAERAERERAAQQLGTAATQEAPAVKMPIIAVRPVGPSPSARRVESSHPAEPAAPTAQSEVRSDRPVATDRPPAPEGAPRSKLVPIAIGAVVLLGLGWLAYSQLGFGGQTKTGGDTPIDQPNPEDEQPVVATQTDSGPAAVDSGPAERMAAVHVESTPPGATILVDGAERGTAPADVQVPIGRAVKIAVRAPRQAAEEQSVTATAANNAPLRFRLAPLPFSVAVETTPPGARVSVIGRAATGTSPATLELGNVQTTVTVVATKPGFTAARQTIEPTAFTEENGRMTHRVTLTLAVRQRPAGGGGGGGAVRRPRPDAGTAEEEPTGEEPTGEHPPPDRPPPDRPPPDQGGGTEPIPENPFQ